MLQFLDFLLTVVHLVIIGFNLFGWISLSLRKLHFIFILVTAASWFILGIWFGIGYCPVTDWQWRIKEKLGETNLPGSFITYFANRTTGHDFKDEFINIITLVLFIVAALISVYVNFFYHKKRN